MSNRSDSFFRAASIYNQFIVQFPKGNRQHVKRRGNRDIERIREKEADSMAISMAKFITQQVIITAWPIQNIAGSTIPIQQGQFENSEQSQTAWLLTNISSKKAWTS